jgi:hypothetical protein
MTLHSICYNLYLADDVEQYIQGYKMFKNVKVILHNIPENYVVVCRNIIRDHTK